MRTVFCAVERFLAIGSADCHWIVPQIWKMYKNNAIFVQFLAHFCHFFAHSFPQGVIIVPKMPERSPINFNSTRTSIPVKQAALTVTNCYPECTRTSAPRPEHPSHQILATPLLVILSPILPNFYPCNAFPMRT